MEEYPSTRTTPSGRIATKRSCSSCAPLFDLGTADVNTAAAEEQRRRTVLVLGSNDPEHVLLSRRSTPRSTTLLRLKSANSVGRLCGSIRFPRFPGLSLRRRVTRFPAGEISRQTDQRGQVIQSTGTVARRAMGRDEGGPASLSCSRELTTSMRHQLKLPPDVIGFTLRHRLRDMVDSAAMLVPALKQVVLIGDRLVRKATGSSSPRRCRTSPANFQSSIGPACRWTTCERALRPFRRMRPWITSASSPMEPVPASTQMPPLRSSPRRPTGRSSSIRSICRCRWHRNARYPTRVG